MPPKETYYDLLKVHPKSTTAEIVAAYHKAKNAFSKSNVATYGLYSEEQMKAVVEKIETAYQTLTHPQKRYEYDQLLESKESPPSTLSPPIVEAPLVAPPIGAPKVEAPPKADLKVLSTPPSPAPNIRVVETLSGEDLKTIREANGHTLEAVARATKIHARYIEALESCRYEDLPARVYVQGFLKTLLAYYRVSSKDSLQHYLSHYDEAKKRA